MYYLRNYRQAFPLTVNFEDLTLHLDDGSVGDVLPSIARLIEERSSRSSSSRRTSSVLHAQHAALFVKTSAIDNLRSKLRVTLGKPRRKGGFDWPIAELINTSEACRLGLPLPLLKGFGYRRKGLGLIEEVFLVSECLEGYVNGVEWLQQNGADVEIFLADAFNLLRELHDKEVFHLDLWAENFMVHPQAPRKLQVIDLENCHIGPAPYLAEVLSFQFGFLYQRCVKDYLDEVRYDQLVAGALSAYPAIDRQRFEEFFQVCKHAIVGRKERREILLRGVLLAG